MTFEALKAVLTRRRESKIKRKEAQREKSYQKMLDDFNIKSSDLYKDSFVVLSLKLFRELCESSDAYLCRDLRSKKEIFKAIQAYLRDLAKEKKPASPMELKKALGQLQSNRFISRLDDILASYAEELRESLRPSEKEQVSVISEDKKQRLKSKIDHFLGPDTIDLRPVYKGVSYRPEDLQALLLRTKDELERVAIKDALEVYFRKREEIIKAALESYEYFLKTGKAPREIDFKELFEKSDGLVFARRELIADRFVARIMALAIKEMEQHKKDNTRKRDAQEPETRKEVIEAGIDLYTNGAFSGIARGGTPYQSYLWKLNNTEQKGSDKDILNKLGNFKESLKAELQEGKSAFKGLMQNSKRGKRAYATAIDLVYNLLKEHDLDYAPFEGHTRGILKSIQKSSADKNNAPYSERTARVILKQVIEKFEEFTNEVAGQKYGFAENEGVKDSEQDRTQEESSETVKQNPAKKGFWRRFAFYTGLSALILALGLRSDTYVSDRYYDAGSAGLGTLNYEDGKKIAVDSRLTKKQQKQKDALEEKKKKLKAYKKLDKDSKDDFYKKRINKIEEEIRRLQESLNKIQAELAKRLKVKIIIEQKSAKSKQNLPEMDSSASNDLAKEKVRSGKFGKKEKAESKYESRAWLVPVSDRDVLERILKDDFNIKVALSKSGFSNTEIEQSMALFREAINFLFEKGLVEHKRFGFPRPSVDFVLIGKGLDLLGLINAPIKTSARGLRVLDVVFSRPLARHFRMTKLDETKLKLAKKIFQRQIKALLT